MPVSAQRVLELYKEASKWQHLPWTLEVQEEGGSWKPLATPGSSAWRYKSEASAEKDLSSKYTKRFLGGAKARPARLEQP